MPVTFTDFFKKVENATPCDYIPVVSTVTSIISLVGRRAISEAQRKEVFGSKEREFKDLEKHSLFRRLVLLVPVIGNFIIGLYDLTHRAPKQDVGVGERPHGPEPERIKLPPSKENLERTLDAMSSKPDRQPPFQSWEHRLDKFAPLKNIAADDFAPIQEKLKELVLKEPEVLMYLTHLNRGDSQTQEFFFNLCVAVAMQDFPKFEASDGRDRAFNRDLGGLGYDFFRSVRDAARGRLARLKQTPPPNP